ncbi:MAG: anthranilate synthase component I family protein, partial [Candidatus Omnitrophica bacterium]|nr:anthranilate synthase component I family protein [Candidatus Omnitrophota bacterium]
EPGVFWLDASDGRGWSYFGVRPVHDWQGRTRAEWDVFKKEARSLIKEPFAGPVPFSSGLMGAVSYDFGLLLEGVSSRHVDERGGGPLFSFGYYDSVLAFDHKKGEAWICGNDRSASWNILFAAADASRKSGSVPGDNSLSVPVSDHDDISYVSMVRRALDYIRCGEIYEVNLSRRLTCPFDGEALALYQRLRAGLPVPYGAYYDAGSIKVLSASPEVFLDLKQGLVLTRPMKGTRPRGKSAAEDDVLFRELEGSNKEKAELLMVTDLLRNDLGKVCETGTVIVKELRTIEKYTNVFQAVSTVEGRLNSGKDAFDLIEAAFPGGSITGCPKHRAAGVIDELESSRRGYYTGALGYISCGGDMKLNMLIRTIILRGGQALFSAGGGIVADSDPVKEFEETALKAEGMVSAL